MAASIALCIVLSIVWCVVVTPFATTVAMPFLMSGGAPGLSDKEKFFIVVGLLGIFAVAYVAVPVLIFFLIL